MATVFGRRRPIPELASGNFQERSLGERLAVNSVIQGSAADIIKVAMIRCYDRLKRDYANALVLQVHDELVFEVPQRAADDVATPLWRRWWPPSPWNLLWVSTSVWAAIGSRQNEWPNLPAKSAGLLFLDTLGILPAHEPR